MYFKTHAQHGVFVVLWNGGECEFLCGEYSRVRDVEKVREGLVCIRTVFARSHFGTHFLRI